MSDKLKPLPCPHCGWKEPTIYGDDNPERIFWVNCPNCSTDSRTREEAIAAWNRRAINSQWVKCEERMPAEPCYVWVNPIFSKEPYRAWFDGDGFYIQQDFHHHIRNPTTWMNYQAPEPPED
jgi:hypothetical protein